MPSLVRILLLFLGLIFPFVRGGNVIRGLYLGYIGMRNVGDDAMFEIAQALFAQAGLGLGSGVVLTPFLPPGDCHLNQLDLAGYSFVVHGGGSILGNPEYQCVLKVASYYAIPVFMFGTGWEANTADGGRQILDEFKRADEPGEFRIDDLESLPVDIQEYMKRITLSIETASGGGFRGMFTESFARALCPNTALRAIGDSGLLANALIQTFVKPPPDKLQNYNMPAERVLKMGTMSSRTFNYNGEVHELETPAHEFLSLDTLNERRLVLMNYGTNKPAGPIFHNNVTLLEPAFYQLASRMAMEHFTVCFYALSAESFADNARMYDLAVAYAREEWPTHGFDGARPEDHIKIMPYLTDTVGILSFLKKAFFSVNYKLHANVLSAAVGLPHINVAYHWKGEEFAHSLGKNILEKYTIRSDEVTLDGFLEKVNTLSRDLHETGSALRDQFNAKVDEVAKDYRVAIDVFLRNVISKQYGVVAIV